MRRTVRDTIISSQPTIGPIRADFEQRFRAAYGEAPDDYTAAAYACTEVILQAMKEAVKNRLEPSGTPRRDSRVRWSVRPPLERLLTG